MTVTLDGYSLTVNSIDDAVEAMASEWDGWENGDYTRKRTVFGKIRRWTLECVEKDVTWVNSAAKHFQEHVDDGACVAFVVSEGNRYSVNTSVYILDVQVTLELTGTANIRRFKVTIQET